MIQAQESLDRLTLRQLRHKASELGVPLYSRKTKAALVEEITLREANLLKRSTKAEKFSSLTNFNTDIGSRLNSKANTKVVFLPRDPQWAYVFWEISEGDKKRAQALQANRLCLRLFDVTGIEQGTSHRQTLQEIPLDSHSTEWYVPIPMSDRDYRVELGFRSASRWISLGFSSTAKVPSLQPSSQILDQFVPFSLEGSTTFPTSVKELSVESNDNGLHERLYQTAAKNFRRTRIGSEEFQEQSAFDKGFSGSGAGIWASGRNESGIGGVVSQESSSWLVADAELVVYGSTDPSAKLTIGGEEVPLSKEGTFRLQVPFRDGMQNYSIQATFIEGDQKRNITMQFERTTPEDNTSPKDQPHKEWF